MTKGKWWPVWKPIPASRPWYLQNEDGELYRGALGEYAKRFESPEQAFNFATRKGLRLMIEEEK